MRSSRPVSKPTVDEETYTLDELVGKELAPEWHIVNWHDNTRALCGVLLDGKSFRSRTACDNECEKCKAVMEFVFGRNNGK